MFTYKIMEDAHLRDVVNCLTDAFTISEPMTRHLKVSAKDFALFCQEVCVQVLPDQLSIVALDAKQNLVGVRLTGKYRMDAIKQAPSSMTPIIALLTQLNSSALAQSELLNHAIHMKMLGVNESLRNQGIAQALLEKTLQQARSLNYKKAFVEATSKTTQHIFINKLNFQTLNEIYYDRFTHEGKRIFNTMKNENKCCLLARNI